MLRQRRFALIIFFLLLLASLVGRPLCAANLSRLDVKTASGSGDMWFVLDDTVLHKAFTLSNPSRIVIDFHHTRLNTTIANNLQSLPGFTRVRVGWPAPDVMRLVLEFKMPVRLGIVQEEAPHRFHVQYLVHDKAQNQALPRQSSPSLSRASVSLAAHAVKPKISYPIHYIAQKAHFVVVLDPGHGGHDPGALGPKKTQEKHITLAIAKRLKTIIDRQPGMRAVLTRDGDYYVGLRERLGIARKSHGDLFISIHADAFHDPYSSGASIFALSQRGATSEAARWLATKENFSELGGVNLKNLDDDSGMVRTVLLDLSQTATISSSLSMGSSVLGELRQVTKLHNRRVEQARFMVLKSPDIPSILIETGFISNPNEERNLSAPAYQERMSWAIYRGVAQYFRMHPLERLARVPNVQPNLYRVRPGDSFASIAAAYRLTEARLKAKNPTALKRGLRPGQRLEIPIA